ncbi:MAG: type II toxin-antitoxin system prevent-host-death family antitoxin [Burkholderiaceae bacterium]
MDKTINAKQLRASLPSIVERVRRGERFTVLYRSRPAFRVVPADGHQHDGVPLDRDPLYRAAAVGRSSDAMTSADHDRVLYGKP